MNTYVLIWIIAIVLFIIIELLTAGLATIWFAAGALVALLFALIDLPFYAQVLIFAVVSAVLLIFTRPFLVEKLNLNATKTNADALIGGEAVVVETIGEFETGQVKINGQIWTAKSLNNQLIEKDCIVTVDHIEGVKLIVKQ